MNYRSNIYIKVCKPIIMKQRIILTDVHESFNYVQTEVHYVMDEGTIHEYKKVKYYIESSFY